MLSGPPTIRRDLVLLGGGHAHVEVLRQFGMKPSPGVRLTLVAREVEAPYSGMLPGHLAGDYERAECHVDLRPLCRFAGARLIHGEAVGLDLELRAVRIDGRPPILFDLLSIDVGGRPTGMQIRGVESAVPVKPVDDFLAGLDEALAPSVSSVAIVGGGAGGVEVAIALRRRSPACRIVLLTAEDHILSSHAPAVRRRMRRALAAGGVELRLGCRVTAIEPGEIQCEGGAAVAADRSILVTPVAAPSWLAASGLAVDEHGFVAVDACLRSTSHPAVFAAGDVAAFSPRPLPKAGVYAVRQGPILAENLRRSSEGRGLVPYRPQRRALALLRSGEGRAVASWGPLAAEGAWIWLWKDRIDRRWVRRYCDLPAMEQGDERADEWRCGGCAAKVASPILHNALERIPRAARPDVLIGLSAPDDASAVLPPPGSAVVQTVDQFRAFLDDPFLFAQIAANHCLNDLYAMGAEPQFAMALATVPFGSARAMEQDLAALTAGAGAVLQASGVALTGGHSAQGPELSFGLSLTGYAPPDRLWRKAGMLPGDALVLTKPLGTGVLLAADMRGRAPPGAMDGAIRAMLQSNAAAAGVLARFGPHACTDVSGFGLLGHLVEMLAASEAGAALDAGGIPALAGAREMLSRGVASMLQETNEAAFAAAVDGAAEPLLFDPQTAGGLLAAVAPDAAEACVEALRMAGYAEACVIGHAVARRSGGRRVTLAGRPPVTSKA